ncbi:MAG: type IV pilus assembly protein PilM [Candidatus Paceibacterota bacterium]|jgi:type IV pilus assembly protein PilM|nr:type IV pilus assembly protein PilM [Candidatus Paceibacterota bacterium]
MDIPNFDIQKMVMSAKSLFKKNESVVGLDIGSSTIKVVQLRKEQGRAVLETYGELAIGPYGGLDVGRATNLPADKIVEAVKDLFREANVTAKIGSISLPLSSALLTLIELPAVDDDKLAKMIPVEARKYIPVPISEVALDWLIIPRSAEEVEKAAGDHKQDKLQIMIVAIHNQVLKKYEEIVKNIGLEGVSFEIEVYSSIRATISRDLSPMMFIDMGAGITKLALVEQGIIKNVHIISRGSQEITIALSRALNISIAKAEKMKREIGLSGRDEESKKISALIEAATSYIFTEANRVLLGYQSKNNKTISKIVLTGGGVLLKGLPEYTKKWLEAEVVFGDSFSKVETPAFLQAVLTDAGPEFSVAIGLALKRLQELG